jgi:glyoxylase-like metal-dependent hydrolase (beta-lactamase superfamily II)
MRRRVVLGLLLAVGVVTATVGAFQQPAGGGQQARVVQVEKVKDNLYVLRGGGGNTAVFIQTNGVVVVDTKNPGWGQPILAEIQKLTDRPVRTIINTHTHGDHVSGNVEFPQSVQVIAHENTAENMEKMATATGIQPAAGAPANIFKENGGKGLPMRTYDRSMTIGDGPDEVNLFYFGRGHTNGDTFVVFPVIRVMHTGDIFPGKQIPLLDANNGGSGVAIADTLTRAAESTGNVDVVIPGHSATNLTVADMRQYAEFNREFMNAVQDAKLKGQTVEQIAGSWKMPAKYAGYAEPAAARLRSNVQVVFDELP